MRAFYSLLEILVNVSSEPNVRLQCEGTFYRMDSAGSTEEQLSSATVTNYNRESNVVTFVLNRTTEGLYFCRSGGDESQKKELVSK